MLTEIAEHRERFLDAMDDDFNTGGAIGELFEIVHALNRFANAARRLDPGDEAAEPARRVSRGHGRAQGAEPDPGPVQPARRQRRLSSGDALTGPLIGLLIDLRARLRKEKNFAMADEIRNRLTELGVTLEDRRRRHPMADRVAIDLGIGLNHRREASRHVFMTEKARVSVQLGSGAIESDSQGWSDNVRRLRCRIQTRRSKSRIEIPDRDGRVVGIDPGLNVTGYAVVEPSARGPFVVEAGVIRPRSACKAMGQRLAWIHQGIVEVLEAFPPGAVALEQVHSHVSYPRTAILMAHARGVIMLAAAQRQTPVFGYAATRIKKTLTGNGRAPKSQIQHAIMTELGLDDSPSRTTSPTPAPWPFATFTSAGTSGFSRISKSGRIRRNEGSPYPVTWLRSKVRARSLRRGGHRADARLLFLPLLGSDLGLRFGVRQR